MKNILHVVNDEKFIVDTDALLGKVPGYQHNYAIIGTKKKLKNLNSLDVLFIHPIFLVLGLRLNFIKNYDAVIFHGLKGFKFNLLKRINDNTPIAWIGWGYDYYSLINPNRGDFLLAQTSSAVVSFKKQKRSIAKVFMKFFEPNLNTKLNALKKIKFFNTVVKEDHYILSKAIGNFIPEYVDWNYPILNDKLIKEKKNLENPTNNLIVGNSASKTNNHLDAFNKIIASKFCDYDEVICPLSYGGNKKYIDSVILGGNHMFQANFQPLNKFYPADEYFEILNNCSFYFSPTLRQQAFGNILLMLYLGKSIILFKENPVYRSLIEKEIKIFSESDLDHNIVRKLTFEEKEKNKRIVIENYSESVLIAKSNNLLNLLVG